MRGNSLKHLRRNFPDTLTDFHEGAGYLCISYSIPTQGVGGWKKSTVPYEPQATTKRPVFGGGVTIGLINSNRLIQFYSNMYVYATAKRVA